MNQPKGIKFDEGKARFSLLPTDALTAIVKILNYGELKYSSHNWRNGFKWSRLYDAAQRHMSKFNNGNRKDEETNMSHIAHATINLLFLLEHEINNLGEDDLWKGYNVNKRKSKKVRSKRKHTNKRKVKRRGS